MRTRRLDRVFVIVIALAVACVPSSLFAQRPGADAAVGTEQERLDAAIESSSCSMLLWRPSDVPLLTSVAPTVAVPAGSSAEKPQ
jgi:hypothetical protein